MPHPNLTDLATYAQTIRTALGIDELEPIDFAQCERLIDDIERRRALFRYFIPDVFTPGKYDRRADLIDACIYYLEALEGKGQFWVSPVLDAWMKRAHFTRKFRFEDVELGPYGYEFYHPAWSVLGDTNNPGLILPKLIRYIRTFKDRKLKLGINEFTLIFFSILNATPPAEIDAHVLRVAEIVHEEIQKPMPDGVELWSVIEHRYPCSPSFARNLAAQFNRVGFRVTTNFERSVFGLGRYILQFPFPHHYEISIHGVPLLQNFLVGGRDNLQEVIMNLPMEELDWKRVLAQLHPESQLYLMTFCRKPMPYASPLAFFNIQTQDWVVPWDSCVRAWEALLAEPHDCIPYDPDWGFLMPDEALVKIAAQLEANPLIRNSELQSMLGVPLERIKELRVCLDQEALTDRSVWSTRSGGSAYCIIDIPGVEMWKYKILEQPLSFFPLSYVCILENLRTTKKSLRAGFTHRPSHINAFARLFQRTFGGKLGFSFHFMFNRLKFPIPFHEAFDPETGNWRNDLADCQIRPMPFAKLQRARGV